MRCLRLSSLVFFMLAAGCSSAYKTLVPATRNVSCLKKFEPAFKSTLYNTQVNVVGKHLSGLLLIKLMADSSTRVVFSSEMGVKFFDFEFGRNGSFKVLQIMKQLNKKAVIKTLKSDFELIFMHQLALRLPSVKKDVDGNTWFGFAADNETHYYIVDAGCDKLVRIENAMRRKPKVQIAMLNYVNGVPDTIGISHKNFNFDIGLKYIHR